LAGNLISRVCTCRVGHAGQPIFARLGDITPYALLCDITRYAVSAKGPKKPSQRLSNEAVFYDFCENLNTFDIIFIAMHLLDPSPITL
jgi:hypothetical protein